MRSTDIDKKIADQTAEILLEVGAFIFRPRQPFRFSSGILSPVYADNRLLISYPKQRKQVLKYLISKIHKIGQPDVIAGVATAGITHAAWIAQKLDLPMVYVRPKPKEHGRQNQVEGKIKRGQKILIVEDMVSTAESSLASIDALRKLGAKVVDEIAIYTHQMPQSKKNFKKANVKFHALTNLQSVAEIAQKKGFLKPDQIATILDWARDPQNWAKKK